MRSEVFSFHAFNDWNDLNDWEHLELTQTEVLMLSRIQHVAIVSENFVREAKFYEAILGMRRSKPGSAEEEKAIKTNYALSVSDGYVGMTIIGRKAGYNPG